MDRYSSRKSCSANISVSNLSRQNAQSLTNQNKPSKTHCTINNGILDELKTPNSNHNTPNHTPGKPSTTPSKPSFLINLYDSNNYLDMTHLPHKPNSKKRSYLPKKSKKSANSTSKISQTLNCLPKNNIENINTASYFTPPKHFEELLKKYRACHLTDKFTSGELEAIGYIQQKTEGNELRSLGSVS